jgi:outer membrane lipoprotein SlyB
VTKEADMKKQILASVCAGLLALTGCSKVPAESAEAAGNPPSVGASGARSVRDVTIPEGTSFRVRLLEALDTRRNRAGDPFTTSLDEPLVDGDRVVVPKGTNFNGHIVASKSSGRFKGRAVLALKLDSFTMDGQTYEIQSNNSSRVSAGHKKHHWLWIGGGSGGGAAIGAIAAGGTGALIGAGAGAAAGTVGSAITGKRQVSLPAETSLRFRLESPVNLRTES